MKDVSCYWKKLLLRYAKLLRWKPERVSSYREIKQEPQHDELWSAAESGLIRVRYRLQSCLRLHWFYFLPVKWKLHRVSPKCNTKKQPSSNSWTWVSQLLIWLSISICFKLVHPVGTRDKPFDILLDAIPPSLRQSSPLSVARTSIPLSLYIPHVQTVKIVFMKLRCCWWDRLNWMKFSVVAIFTISWSLNYNWWGSCLPDVFLSWWQNCVPVKREIVVSRYY